MEHTIENPLEKVLVCIEDVTLDEHLIEYTYMIAKTVGLKSVHLLHVIHDTPCEERLSRPSEIEGTSQLDLDEEYKEEIQRLTTAYIEALRKIVAKHFGDQDDVTPHIIVKVGNQLKDTIRIAHERDIDLIVMGRHLGARLELGDAALLPHRITRKATCSVLVIPEDFSPKLTKILCPVRHSKCSELALQMAADLGVAFDAEIHAINLYHIYNEMPYPGGSPELLIPRDQKLEEASFFAKRENESLRRKIKSNGADIQFESHPDDRLNPAEMFEKRAEELGCDLLVIGARGRTGAAGVLLGTITEQLIKQCKVPLLCTRQKGEQIGLLKAMLALFGKE